MNYCNKCSSCGKDPCGCGCKPARYGCDFGIDANPFDPSIWNVTINGATTRVKIPKMNETDTKLSTSYSSASLKYNAEKHTDVITGSQLGSLINLNDLRDVRADNPDSCSIMAFHPYCGECGGACTPKEAMWEAYTIPDAGDCVMEADEDGYYHALKKTDCGCIVECKIPEVPVGMAPSGVLTINYERDSVPDDPDFPWYYGCYNDTINLYLAANAPEYFGKYDMKVTVNYGVQCILSSVCPNYNFRSIIVPVVQGQPVNVLKESSILQGFCGWKADGDRSIPWGTQSLRGTITFIVPKGKEAYLHHEYRVRKGLPQDGYYTGPWDGQKVPDSEAQLNSVLHPASRLNALQVIIEPTAGTSNYDPTTDPIRDQLDAPDDVYPNPVG